MCAATLDQPASHLDRELELCQPVCFCLGVHWGRGEGGEGRIKGIGGGGAGGGEEKKTPPEEMGKHWEGSERETRQRVVGGWWEKRDSLSLSSRSLSLLREEQRARKRRRERVLLVVVGGVYHVAASVSTRRTALLKGERTHPPTQTGRTLLLNILCGRVGVSRSSSVALSISSSGLLLSLINL